MHIHPSALKTTANLTEDLHGTRPHATFCMWEIFILDLDVEEIRTQT